MLMMFQHFLMKQCDLLPPRQALSLEFSCSFDTAVCCFLKCYAFYSASVTYKKSQLLSPRQSWFSAGLMSSTNTEGVFLVDSIFPLLPLPHRCSHKLPLWTQMTPDFWNSLKRQTTNWTLILKNSSLRTHLPACVNDVGFPPLCEEQVNGRLLTPQHRASPKGLQGTHTCTDAPVISTAKKSHLCHAEEKSSGLGGLLLSKLKLSLHSASPQNAVRTSYRKDPARIRRKILENTVKRTVQYLKKLDGLFWAWRSLQLFMCYTYILHDKHKTFGGNCCNFRAGRCLWTQDGGGKVEKIYMYVLLQRFSNLGE